MRGETAGGAAQQLSLATRCLSRATVSGGCYCQMPAAGLTGFKSKVCQEQRATHKQRGLISKKHPIIYRLWALLYLMFNLSTSATGWTLIRSEDGARLGQMHNSIKWTALRRRSGSGRLTDQRWMCWDPTFLYAMIISEGDSTLITHAKNLHIPTMQCRPTCK